MYIDFDPKQIRDEVMDKVDKVVSQALPPIQGESVVASGEDGGGPASDLGDVYSSAVLPEDGGNTPL